MGKDDVVVPVGAPSDKEKFMEHMKGLFPNATEKQLDDAWERHSSTTLTDQIVAATQSYGEMLVKELQAKFDKQLEETLAEQQQAIVDGVRKGLGIDDNPAIHLKDLDGIVRDLVMKHSDPGKKGKAGDEGTPEQPGNTGDDEPYTFDFSKRLEEDLKNRGAPGVRTWGRRSGR